MRIMGPDEVVFGVDDVEASRTFLVDFGLEEQRQADGSLRFAALDGTAIRIHHREAEGLPAPLPTANSLRQTVWGVEDQAALDAIAEELSQDREVRALTGGGIGCRDDVGFEIAFQVTVRRPLDLPPERINSPGAAPGRGANQVGADEKAPALPRTLSHVVYFTPDMARMQRFYIDRLGFVVTDHFTNTGPFLRPQANDDHHVLFLLQTPDYMQGLEHIAFHMQGPSELMLAGTRMINKGYESFWGPGKHKFGSNWFWYFNSPMGVHVEYDADMDKHDERWTAREAPSNAETSQLFLFQSTPKWAPMGGPPPGKEN
ncbi:glyoxalase/bleomycin resistance protein/dioxygenase superfamily protein [Chromohalobacter marismortui]|uniref:Glyoxalase/bleomycin resistance protein/dioxygenase superfamily protein n=1 Tax=Chromohalobacter marismortui TaxID=42055 RepID=A0A4R7NMI7_9GAMM|nr:MULTISPECIES: VOC family protein [Chromohalobacter]MCI0509656.1 VOC family protein [Chromohalobacter sp.]MCI0593669.1 VOC family protein [Chromohalobacter sp.]TDU21877.1 glyoxalase/bleomycin resistance protein/dioxygenase superfamily protein [Chromohalobacter marismortui]